MQSVTVLSASPVEKKKRFSSGKEKTTHHPTWHDELTQPQERMTHKGMYNGVLAVVS
jgi:hypothetical protein